LEQALQKGSNNFYPMPEKESKTERKERELMEHNKIQAALKSPMLIDSSLDPLELPVFDPKIIEGLKFQEQQMVRAKFLNETH
jgi:hypothetical protein